jgi:hypothetical protein
VSCNNITYRNASCFLASLRIDPHGRLFAWWHLARMACKTPTKSKTCVDATAFTAMQSVAELLVDANERVLSEDLFIKNAWYALRII